MNNKLKLTENNEVVLSTVEEKRYSEDELDMKMNELLCDLLIKNRKSSLINNPNTNAIAQYIMDWTKENS